MTRKIQWYGSSGFGIMWVWIQALVTHSLEKLKSLGVLLTKWSEQCSLCKLWTHSVCAKFLTWPNMQYALNFQCWLCWLPFLLRVWPEHLLSFAWIFREGPRTVLHSMWKLLSLVAPELQLSKSLDFTQRIPRRWISTGGVGERLLVESALTLYILWG